MRKTSNSKTSLTLAVVALTGGAAFSCRTASPSLNGGKLREFRRLEQVESQPFADFRLAMVSEIAGPPIKYEATRVIYNWGLGFEEPHLHVTFPALTRAQFDKLKARYGFGLSRVQYKAGEQYTLADFLMPFMQATLDHEFEPEIQEDFTKIASNCWGTAYEVIRTSSTPSTGIGQNDDLSASAVLFYAGTKEMQTVLQDDHRGQLIAKAESMDALYKAGLASGERLRPGDTLLILSSEGELEHAVTNIDRDVWFEKVGYSAGAPYRLTTTTDFFHQVNYGRVVEWRRFPRGGLPHPAEVFKSWQFLATATDGSTTVLDTPLEHPLTRREVRFVFDALGRASLEAKAYQPVRAGEHTGLNLLPTVSKYLTSQEALAPRNPPF